MKKAALLAVCGPYAPFRATRQEEIDKLNKNNELAERYPVTIQPIQDEPKAIAGLTQDVGA
ncbi:MAG: hypothetical protein AAGJ94_15970 [Pseudomonadota bacterium]